MEDKQKKMYLRFAGMMSVSFVYMYAAMFLNVDTTDHIMLSYTRTYMTFLMVAPMAIIMLGFMWSMYKNKKVNYAIVGVAAICTLVFFWLLRDQIPVDDEAYMEAMIPHHSSAIMVSQKANLEDPELQQLALEIIEAQEKEIAQMKKILQRLEEE